MLIAVALANKLTRIVWALLTKGGVYRDFDRIRMSSGRGLSKM
jgi:hypothetical protein